MDKLNDRIYKDAIKKLSCLHKNITLIVIPYTIDYLDLYSYILEQLISKKIIQLTDYPKTINYSILSIKNQHDILIEQINKFIAIHNKVVISDLKDIISKKSQIVVLCRNNHKWEGPVRSLFNNKCISCRI